MIMSELEAAKQAARKAERLVLQQSQEIDRAHVTNSTLAQVLTQFCIKCGTASTWMLCYMAMQQHNISESSLASLYSHPRCRHKVAVCVGNA